MQALVCRCSDQTPKMGLVLCLAGLPPGPWISRVTLGCSPDPFTRGCGGLSLRLPLGHTEPWINPLQPALAPAGSGG